MSGAAWWWLSAGVYLVVAVGTWRYLFSEFYVGEIGKRRDAEKAYEKLYVDRGMSYTKDSLDTVKSAAMRSADVWIASLALGMFWPVVVTVIVIGWPIKIMGSLFVKWFLHLANRKADQEFA